MKTTPQSSVTRVETNFKLLPMAATYCFGVFNDNYFKQAAMLIAVTLGVAHLQGTATLLFALPFVLFSAVAGWTADHYIKKRVIVLSKALECLAMVIGAAGLLLGNWYCLLAMIFIMGLQSTFFSPALNGSIPEVYSPAEIPRVNGIIKLLTTLAVLVGVACAGLSLDVDLPFGSPAFGSGVYLVSAIILLTSLGGLLTSLYTEKKPSSESRSKFPLLGPLDSIKDTILICRDPQLLLAFVADVCFYFMASLIVLSLNALGIQVLGLSKGLTSMFSVSLMVGLSVGSLLVSRRVDLSSWSRYLVSSSVGIGLSLLLASLAPLLPTQFGVVLLLVTLAAAGIAGGFLLIPVTSFLQTYPGTDEKGKVLAASNFCAFCAILSSGVIYNLLNSIMSPPFVLIFIGLIALFTGSLLFTISMITEKKFKTYLSALFRWVLSLRYRVKIVGLENIKPTDKRGTLFLPNHPALIDPVLIMAHLFSTFEPRSLSDSDQISKPLVKHIIKLINPIVIPDLSKYGESGKQGVMRALHEVINSLKQNENVLVYPSGRLYRSRFEELGGNSGTHFILKHVPDARVILVRTSGLWGSSLSRAESDTPSFGANISKMITFALVNFLFLGPRREVTIEFYEDKTVKAYSDKNELNHYLQQFYNEKSHPNRAVPYFWWQGSEPIERAEPVEQKKVAPVSPIAPETEAMVKEKVELLTGLPISSELRLASDLGIDSLNLLELAEWVQEEFGVQIKDLQTIETVEDLIIAAGGDTEDQLKEAAQTIPAGWFKGAETPLTLGSKTSITSLFLDQALAHKGKIIVSDQISGCKSYREILTAIFLLIPTIKEIKEERVGIMLPASVSSAIVYLATLFSNKVPVMFNWTVGTKAMRSGIEQTGVTRIITAQALCNRIEAQGTNLSEVGVDWIYLETFRSSLTPLQKITALCKAQFSGSALSRYPVPKTAVILFTSGSESLPKAVPLSHENILANLYDFATMTGFGDHDRLLGMLPPFHSLGLAGTIILPLCMGLKTVYHPNPTEAAILADIIDRYEVTTLIGTPTFLGAIIHTASKEQLKTLGVVFTGAEKCSDQVYREFRGINPDAHLCEGYGITECSPLVSLNSPEVNYPGTIGTIMPSLEYAIINEESKGRVRKGQRGILLLRGPSIFSGYLNDTTERGFTLFENKMWYNTGDFVSESAPRILSFEGRKKRFIKAGGEMISLVAIEDNLSHHFAAETDITPHLAVEAVGEDGNWEIVLLSTFDTTPQIVNNILKINGLSPLHKINRICRIKEVPILGSGKTDYKQLKQMLTKQAEQPLLSCVNQ